ncbi:hypothetical protein ACWF94_24810 [Streptomyces sp. NPDC055078]
MNRISSWATGHPWPAAAALIALALLAVGTAWVLVRALRSIDRPPAAVTAAAIAAACCTAYSADTSWRFAAHHLDMASTVERGFMFAAAELALFATALMARQNLRESGAPGIPGILVWVITGVQIIPAFAESGLLGGTVRAFVGPVLAALLWHLAMGIELRHSTPGARSGSLPAVIGRELRERLLSRLGLATRDRSAEQITRDRATAQAVRLAARPRLRAWGRRRLAAAVARARVGTDGEQRHRLLQELAARRTSGELATVPLPSPWTYPTPAAPYPETPLGVTGAQLRALDPADAIRRVHAAHPQAHPRELAALCTEYGVPVTEMLVRIATRAGNPDPPPRTGAGEPERPVLAAVPGPGLHLDLAPTGQVHPEVRTRVPVLAAAPARTRVSIRVPEPESGEGAHVRVPDHGAGPVPAEPRTPGTGDQLARAREVDADHRRTHGRPASIRVLKRELSVGQPTAQRVRAQLDQAGES